MMPLKKRGAGGLPHRERELERELAAVLAQADDLDGLADQARGGHAALGDALDAGVVHRAEALGHEDRERLADDLVLDVAEHQLGAAVPGDDVAVLVGGDDRVGGGLGDRAEAVLGLAQGVGRAAWLAIWRPSWRPMCAVTSSRRSSGVTACSEKHSMTANVLSPIGIGKEKAPRRPTSAPASARGKLASQVTSTIQAGRPVAATRPGRPMPGASGVPQRRGAERLELARVTEVPDVRRLQRVVIALAGRCRRGRRASRSSGRRARRTRGPRHRSFRPWRWRRRRTRSGRRRPSRSRTASRRAASRRGRRRSRRLASGRQMGDRRGRRARADEGGDSGRGGSACSRFRTFYGVIGPSSGTL